MLQADVLKPSELSSKDKEAWEAFRAESSAFGSPLLSASFCDAVGQIRADAAVAVFRRRGVAVGFLAHHRRPGSLARPIGAPWSDYHALVSAPDAALDGAAALRAAGLSSFRFSGLIDPYGIFVEAEAEQHDAYVIAIARDADGPAYWEELRTASPKRFKNMRRLEHKLGREVGEPVLMVDHDHATFERLLNWKSAQLRRSGLHDVLHAPASRRLMQSLFLRREGPLQGLLISLKIGDRLIAAHFGVRLADAYHPWVAAYDPTLASYSPGLTFMSEAIRAMPRFGLVSYDLSAGGDHYKRSFACSTVVIREGVLRTAKARLSLRQLGATISHRAGPTMRRVERRLDHIAAAELSLSGRLHGFATALSDTSRRLQAHSASTED